MTSTSRTIAGYGRVTLITVAIAFVCFIILGMPSGLINIAWSSIQTLFGLPAEQIGTLLLASQAGYIVSSFLSGRIALRYGNDGLLLVGAGIAAVGLAGFAVSPVWAALLTVSILMGLGGGALDAGMNSFFAMNFGPRLMNLLHASYGLGSTLGALALTGLLDVGASWRWGYALVALAQGAVALAFLFTRSRWRMAPQMEVSEDEASAPGVPAATARRSGRSGDVWLSVLLFFCMSGVEMSAGQWSFALFTDGRGVNPTTAGLWVSFYWGSFTAGRVFFGVVGNRIPLLTGLRGSMAGLLLGGVMLAWPQPLWLNFAGLAVMGLCVAPLFPLLTIATPVRLGRQQAIKSIGYQVAAASLGIGLFPGAIGFVVERTSVESIAPFLIALTAVVFLLHELIQWRRPV